MDKMLSIDEVKNIIRSYKDYKSIEYDCDALNGLMSNVSLNLQVDTNLDIDTFIKVQSFFYRYEFDIERLTDILGIQTPIKELRSRSGMTQKEFSDFFNIPVRTIQDWESGRRTPPEYVVELIQYKLKKEGKDMESINVLFKEGVNLQKAIIEQKEHRDFKEFSRSLQTPFKKILDALKNGNQGDCTSELVLLYSSASLPIPDILSDVLASTDWQKGVYAFISGVHGLDRTAKD